MSRVRPNTAHGDQRRFIEDHVQTAQKLTVFRGYLPIWGSILAASRSSAFNHRDLFIVDTHAGAGLHGSREHPDGYVFGTPLIACHEARRLQRRHKGLRVHVIAIDNDPRWITFLRQRTDAFVSAADDTDRVDVRLVQADFADVIGDVLTETTMLKAASLWLVDPFGIDLPFDALKMLGRPSWGPEVVINLDLLGIWRVDGALAKAEERMSDLLVNDIALQRCLRRTFGGTDYVKLVDRTQSFQNNIPALAAGYADQFRRFQHRHPYLLYSTKAQARALVHLCHHETGVARFREVFLASQEVGVLAGTRLDLPKKAHSAARYHEAYAGQATSLDRLYEEHLFPYTRQQIKWVCEIAEEDGRGRLDERAGIMNWSDEKTDTKGTEASQTTLAF